MKRTLKVLLAVATCAVLAGCGEKDCFFETDNAALVSKGAPVVWSDAFVGKVTAIDGNRVSFELGGEYAERIRAGVAARIVTDSKLQKGAIVLLVGGRDGAMPVLADGAQIPEARATAQAEEGVAKFIGWFRGSESNGSKAGCGFLVILLAALKLVKKAVKWLIRVLILCTLIAVAFLTRSSWQQYTADLESAVSGAKEAAAWVQQHVGALGGAANEMQEFKDSEE